MGISLTAANRVILVDPDFNPQTDIQVEKPPEYSLFHCIDFCFRQEKELGE